MTGSKEKSAKPTETFDTPRFEEIKISVQDENHKNFLGTLGMCAGAGKLVFGAPMICEELRRGRLSAPIAAVVASDVSANTRKMLHDKCAFYGIMFVETDITMARLSAAVGKKTDIAAVGIIDSGFLRALKLKA